MPACRTPTTSGWKLLAVLRGDAPEALLDSYDAERIAAADENILASTRSTEFIAPKDDAARGYRDAVLDLAELHAVRAPAGQFGAAVAAGAAARQPAEHAGRRALGRRAAARRAGRGRPGDARRPARLAAAPDRRRRLHPAAVQRPRRAAGRGAGGARRTRAPWRPPGANGYPVRSVFVSPVEADGVLWDHRGWPPPATTRSPARRCCCVPTSMWWRAGASFDAAAVAAARRRALGVPLEERRLVPA